MKKIIILFVPIIILLQSNMCLANDALQRAKKIAREQALLQGECSASVFFIMGGERLTLEILKKLNRPIQNIKNHIYNRCLQGASESDIENELILQSQLKKYKKEKVSGKKYNKKKIIAAQSALKEMGYNPGIIDGIFGSKTSNAIKKWQINNGYSVDGKLFSFISSFKKLTCHNLLEKIRESVLPNILSACKEKGIIITYQNARQIIKGNDFLPLIPMMCKDMCNNNQQKDKCIRGLLPMAVKSYNNGFNKTVTKTRCIEIK